VTIPSVPKVRVGFQRLVEILMSTFRLITLAAVAIAAASLPARADLRSIDFERASHPRALPGAAAAMLYSGWGVTFPSGPVIERDARRNQVLQQGSATGGPDPIPRSVRCAPLVIEFDRSMGVREVRLRVINRHLRTYSVSARSGRTEVDVFHFVPTSETRPRPVPLVEYRDVVLRAAVDEGHIDRVEALPPDGCFDLMVIDNLTFDALRPRPLPSVVWATAYEVNQGVMPQLTMVTDPLVFSTPNTRLMALPEKRLPFVRNRNTAVRFYVSSTIADIPNYAARLRVGITTTDGRTVTQTINENARPATGAPSPSEPQVMRLDWLGSAADIRHHLIGRRGRTDQSHDFVLPAAQLQNAARAELVLLAPDGDALARVRVDFLGPFTIGLNYFRVQGMGTPVGAVAIGGPIALEPQRGRIRAFMRDLMPVSGSVRSVNRGVISVSEGIGGTDNCNSLLATLSGMAVGTSAVAGVNYWTNVFVAQNTPPDCAGLGYYGIQAALTLQTVDVASHEVSHNVGVVHASNMHGEARWPEAWPYGHGSIGTIDEPQSFFYGVYGIAVTQRSATPTTDWGSWSLDVVNPCPGAAAGIAEFPTCGLGDGQMVHDYMSYGPATPMPTYGNVHWISDINYFRIFRFLQDCVSQDPPAFFLTGSTATYDVGGCLGARPAAGATGAAAGAARMGSFADGLVFSGVLSSAGKVESFRVLRKLVASPPVKRGDFSLVMRGKDGKILRTVPFNGLAADDKAGRRGFLVSTPFEPALGAVEIREGQRSLFERKASAARPEIQLSSPKGGEIWRQGKQKIAWLLRDADGDKLETFVAYSADGGKSWLPIGLVDGRTTSIDVDVANLAPTNAALVYVAVSDGLNTSAAQSAGTFTISNVGQQE